MKEQIQCILINGYGWSGSSALIDMMREFKGIYVPAKEFRLIKDPHGIVDLDRALTNPIDALNEDNAIREFIEFMKIYSRTSRGLKPLGLWYEKNFSENIKKITEEYISSLYDYQYKGYWWYLDMHTPYWVYIIHKILRRLKIYNHKEHTKMYLQLKSEEEFLRLTRDYLNAIFTDILSKHDFVNKIVLDQAIPANHAEYANRYFYNSKVIVVDRDPRDVYIDLINEKSLVGYDVAVRHDVTLFVNWFKKVRKSPFGYDGALKIQFENLIKRYDETVSIICDYLGLDKSSQISPRKYLNPDVSAKNIGLWKKYDFPKEIRMIENELSEYLVYD